MTDNQDPKAVDAPEPKPGDAEAARGGDDDGRDAGDGDRRTDWKAKYLTEVTPALEEKNRLAARAKALEEELQAAKQPPTASVQSAPSDLAELKQYQADLAAAQIQADNGDATSKVALKNAEMMLRLHQERMEEKREAALDRANRDYLSDMTEVDAEGEERPATRAYRQRVIAFYERNKSQFSSLEAAHDAMLGRELRETQAALRKQTKQVAEDAKRRDTEGVVRTAHRDVTAPEIKARKFVNEEAFKKELDRLRASGDEGAAYNLMLDRRTGRAVVNG